MSTKSAWISFKNVCRGIERLLCLIFPRKSAFVGKFDFKLHQIFYNITIIAPYPPLFFKSGDRTSKMHDSRQNIIILFVYTPYFKDIGV